MTAFWKCISCQGMGKVYMGDETRWWSCPSCGGRGYSVSAIASALLMSVIIGLGAYRIVLGKDPQVAVMRAAKASPAAPTAVEVAPLAGPAVRAD